MGKELEKTTVSWPEAQRALRVGYGYAFNREGLLRYVEQGACVRAAWLAVKADDPGYLAKSKVAKACQNLVEGQWTADEKLLTRMLEEQTIEVEPEVRRGM